MRSQRWADIVFFIGFGGILWAILAGSWNPEGGRFVMTVGVIVGGLLLIALSIVLLHRQKVRRDEDENKD